MSILQSRNMIFIPIEQADHFSRRIRSCWNSSSVRARSGQRKGQNSWPYQRGHCNLRTYSTLITSSITYHDHFIVISSSFSLLLLIPSTFHPTVRYVSNRSLFFLVLNNIVISVDFKRTLSEFRAPLRVHSAEEGARPGTGILVGIFRLVIVHGHLRWRHANVETVL